MFNVFSRATSEGPRDFSCHYICECAWLFVVAFFRFLKKKKNFCRVVLVPKEQKEKKSRTPKIGRTTKRHEVWTQEDKDVFFEALAEVVFHFSKNCGVADTRWLPPTNEVAKDNVFTGVCLTTEGPGGGGEVSLVTSNAPWDRSDGGVFPWDRSDFGVSPWDRSGGVPPSQCRHLVVSLDIRPEIPPGVTSGDGH